MTAVRASVPPVRRERDDPWWLALDPPLIVATVGITALGLVLVYSATRGPVSDLVAPDRSFLERQAFFAVAGAVLAGVTVLIPPSRLRALLPLAYLGVVVSLVGVLVLGREINGARAWFELAGIRFQPSEPGKLVAIVALAWILSSERLPLRRLAAALASVGLLVALILLQPDLGTVLVYVAVTVALVVVSGVRARVIVALALVAATGTFAVFQSDVLADYQKARLTIFLFDEGEVSPDLAPYAYNAEQAQIAIGNGGLTGQGLFQGTQTRSDLVPEQQTDFIFTVAGEELGFRGAGLLLGLFGLLVFRIWRIAMRARDRFDRLIAVGVMVMFLFQIFQSVGMTMGMMPVTGIPLPLVSYGGSSMITSLVALGLVAGVHRRRFS